ncbi:ABC transporter substrate-binding protein [Uliginosibacterium sp. sgz301328]|uniref:ABC transporter substrate-binding protein n=1 Tax=Uliginosibacterium sp. sgz301328 TaxID=3243764 RepID=UPI00359E90A3
MTTRRDVLKMGLLTGAGALCSPLSAWAADINMRMFYWGAPDRVKRTDAVDALFNKTHPGIVVASSASADHWAKLNTSMAGGNMPDIVQLEPNTLPDYARRRALISLDDYIAKGVIRTADLDKGVLDLCKVDGKMAGMALGLNSFAMIYDKAAYAKAGIPEPKYGLTWDEFARQAVEITKASGKNRYWGAPYLARANYILVAWLAQRGKNFFTEDQQLGFNVDDVREFYTYWDKLLKAGGCTPGDLSAKNMLNPDSSEMNSRNCSCALLFSSQLTAFHSLLPDVKLGIAPLPVTQPNGPSGLFYRPALSLAISKDAKNPEAAAKYIDYFVNDMDAGKVLEVERGIPPNVKVRAEVYKQLNEYEKMSVDFINTIQPIVMKYPPASPAGAIEIDVGVMRPIGEQLAYGKLNVADAAKKMVDDSTRVLRRASGKA